MKKEIVKSTILLTTLCFALSQSVIAAENKELVRMDLDQNSDGSVKVNIYTDKPYTEQIIVNKKPDNKYVILLPETVNAMGVKPDVSLGIQNEDKNLAKAEAEYNAATAKINTKEKKLDQQMKEMDTEHNALKTEYDSVKSLIGDNISKSFQLFS